MAIESYFWEIHSLNGPVTTGTSRPLSPFAGQREQSPSVILGGMATPFSGTPEPGVDADLSSVIQKKDSVK